MVQDQLETAKRIDPVVECDLDDRAEPLLIALRPVVEDRPGHAIGLADCAEIGPGRRDVGRVEVLGTDQANDLDIPLFESRPFRLGQLRQRTGWDQGESQLVSGAEQEGVEQGPVVAGGVEVLR